ncbi:hypothetical protein FOL46_006359 [Perkinsus olseni]|uniref:Sumo ligase n=1 Tax=Perkinsus olseni TaxID=32597 RepID=A0A7J6LLH3_PEROL|nr:hypothetical protein FOL46_006359 [Perkinsus olseni]
MGPASASEIATTLQGLPSFTVNKLKDYCRHMSLKVTGRKAELVERIRAAVEQNPDLLTAALVWPPLLLPTGQKNPSKGNSSHAAPAGRRPKGIGSSGKLPALESKNARQQQPPLVSIGKKECRISFILRTANSRPNVDTACGMKAIRDPAIEAAFARMDPFWPLASTDNEVYPRHGIFGLWRITGAGTFETHVSVPDSSCSSVTGARVWARMIAIPSNMATHSEGNNNNNNSTTGNVSLQHVWPYSFLLEFDDGAGIKVSPPEHLRKRRDCPLDITDCIPPHQTAARFKVTVQLDPKLTLSAASQLHYVLAIVMCVPKDPSALLAEIPVENVRLSASRMRSILSRRQDEDDLQISGSSDEVDAETRSLRLTCPLSYMRMDNPARGRDCSHIQCFDLEWFIRAQKMMGAFNNRWKCAICDTVLRPDAMLIDGYILGILRSTEDSQAEEVFVTKATAEWSVSPPATDEEQSAAFKDTRDSDGCCSFSTASTRSSAVDGQEDGNLDTSMPLKRARLEDRTEHLTEACQGASDEHHEESTGGVVDLCDDDSECC